MAGTNDLRNLVPGDTLDRNRGAVIRHGKDAILSNLRELYQMALEAGVKHILAVGIPPSSLQHENSIAKVMAHEVNHELSLQALNSTNNNNMTYVPFPFKYVVNGTNWCPHGIHFSCQGYQELGEYLAPWVQNILLKPE